MIELQVEKRESTEKRSDLGNNGYIPAVFYGPKEDSTPIKIKEKDFISAYDKAGESTILSLKEGSNEHEVLIHDVQFDAVTGQAIHADFYVIEKGKKVEVAVPINFVGTAPAEKQLGGVLVKVVHELPIKAMPKDLPSEIEADISVLVDFETQLRACDIKLGEGVELDVDAEEVIALVQAAKEEEEEPATEASIDDIEVEGKGKKEEGEEGGDAASAEGGEKKEG